MKSLFFLFTIAICSKAYAQSNLNELHNLTVNDLRQIRKYEVYAGTYQIFTSEKCAEGIKQFGNCFGANPAAPYIIPSFLPANGEWYDDSYSSFLSVDQNDKTYHAVLRQHKTEARVVLMNLPGRAAYLGYQSYLMSRKGTPDSSWIASLLPDTYHPNAERYSVFNGISNPINNVVIAKQLGKPEAWSQGIIALITSADSKTAADVKSSLINAGLSANRIFVESIGDHQKMGLLKDHDDFISLIRYSLPETQNNENFYVKPSIRAFRVLTRKRENTAPYSRQSLENRGARQESYLAAAQVELAEKLKNRLIQSAQEQSFFNPLNFGIDTYACIDKKRNCLGETRDTDTYFKSAGFILNNQQVAIIVGVNHTLSGNGTYVSLSVNDDEQIRPAEMEEPLTGLKINSLSQAGTATNFSAQNRKLVLEGSAQRIVSQLGLQLSAETQNYLRYFYVKIIKRKNCGVMKECVHLSSDESRGVPLSAKVNMMRRIYLKPGTQRGPRADYILAPILNVGTSK